MSKENLARKPKLCVIEGKSYPCFKDNAFFDTGSSHVMDTNKIGMYNAEPIHENVGGFGDELVVTTWRARKITGMSL